MFLKFLKDVKKKNTLLIIIISFIGSSIYFQSYNFSFTVDDTLYTLKNKATNKGLDDLHEIFSYGSLYFYEETPTNEGIYRPITLLTFNFEKFIFGEFNPSNGHIFNITLYFIVLLIIGLLLIKIFPQNIPNYIPLLILLLYALHPIHTEVVASIKSRDILLSAFFSFSAIYLWVLYYKKLKLFHLFFIAFVFFLSLLSKEESLTIIAIVFLISFFFLNQSILKSIKHIFPFLIAGFIFIILRIIILDPPSSGMQSVLNNVLYTAQGEQRIATNFYVYFSYIKLLFLPHPLSWDYSFSHITLKSFNNISVIISILFFFSMAYIALKGFTKKKIIAFGILFYFATFSIFANLTPSITIGSNMAERFMFIPSLGFCIVFVYSIYALSKKIKFVKAYVTVFFIVGAISIFYYSKSYSRTAQWKDNLALTSADIKNTENSWRSNFSYATNCRIYADQFSKMKDSTNYYSKKIDSLYSLAAFHYQKAFNIIGYKKQLKSSFSSLGNCYLKIGDTLNAEKIFLKGAKYPELYEPLINLGIINSNRNNYQEGLKYYLKALKADNPNLSIIYKNIGNTYLKLKDFSKATDYYEKVLENGDDQIVRENLFILYSRSGNIKKALEYKSNSEEYSEEELKFSKLKNTAFAHYQSKNYDEVISKLLHLKRDYLKFGGIKKHPLYLEKLATSYFLKKDYKNSKIVFLEILKEDKQVYNAHMYLGFIAYHSEKNISNAIYHFEQCLSSKSPDYFVTYKNLGGIYSVNKELSKAINAYEKALKYRSDSEVLKNLKLLKTKNN